MMTIVENRDREEQEAAGSVSGSSSFNSLASKSDSDASSGSGGGSDDDDSDTGAANSNSRAADEYMGGGKKKNNKKKDNSTPNGITIGNDFLHMAKILTQVVMCSKVLVYVVLVMAAAAAGAVTYVYTSRAGNAVISQLENASDSGVVGRLYQEAVSQYRESGFESPRYCDVSLRRTKPVSHFTLTSWVHFTDSLLRSRSSLLSLLTVYARRYRTRTDHDGAYTTLAQRGGELVD